MEGVRKGGKRRPQGARGVCRDAGACGIVFGAFAGASSVRWEEGAFARARGRVALFLGRSQGARNACMIFSQQT